MNKPIGQGGPGRGQGRPPGTKNKPGHKAGRPRSAVKIKLSPAQIKLLDALDGDPSKIMGRLIDLLADYSIARFYLNGVCHNPEADIEEKES